jgi:hypothetical protein
MEQSSVIDRPITNACPSTITDKPLPLFNFPTSIVFFELFESMIVIGSLITVNAIMVKVITSALQSATKDPDAKNALDLTNKRTDIFIGIGCIIIGTGIFSYFIHRRSKQK